MKQTSSFFSAQICISQIKKQVDYKICNDILSWYSEVGVSRKPKPASEHTSMCETNGMDLNNLTSNNVNHQPNQSCF